MKKLSNVALFVSLSVALGFSVKSAQAEEVYFVRGGFDVFSTGMNEMANQLKAKGIKASAHSIMAWKGIANDIIKRSKTKSVSYPIIFLGHSLGADAAPEFADYLGQNGISVDLVIGFDATGNRIFHKGAKKVINYHNTHAGRYIKGQGFRGSLTEIDVTKFGGNHFNIEKVTEVQALAMKAVLSQLRRR